MNVATYKGSIDPQMLHVQLVWHASSDPEARDVLQKLVPAWELRRMGLVVPDGRPPFGIVPHVRVWPFGPVVSSAQVANLATSANTKRFQ